VRGSDSSTSGTTMEMEMEGERDEELRRTVFGFELRWRVEEIERWARESEEGSK
jgi:hypothetical protein